MRRISKKDKELWITIIAITILAIIFWISNFWSNCIWEWPIRWDIVTCAKEQWHPAVEKAVRWPN